jgi:hypothetical protein
MVLAMSAYAGNISRAFLVTIASAGILALVSVGAYAAAPATPEGCDPLVEKAQQSKAEARVAYDVAVTEEHIQKPDSTLATTCFNNLSGINASGAAGGGGTIFSGEFISQSPSGNPGGVRADIQDALQTFYTAYVDAMGADSGLVDYTQTNLVNNPACSETQDLWTEVKQGGVDQGVPYATITDLINGTIPAGANTDYTNNWTTSKTTDNNFSTLKADLANQPLPNMPAYNPNADFCTDLMAAGVATACP